MRTEHELQQDIENYESFFNTIDDFLFILDERGNILLTNSTVTGRLGYRSEELAGKSVLLVHPESRRAEAGRIVAEMLEGTAQMCPVPLITKSGVQIPVETRITRGIWNGKPALFGVTKDISRVQLSEEKFSKLFHLNPSACGLSSLDDNTYIEVNDAFVSLFGYTREEIIGKSAIGLEIMTPEVIATVLAKADSDGKISGAEADLRSKNGGIKHVLLSAENIMVQDRHYRFTVVQDITDRKQAEDRIRSLLAEKELLLKEVNHRIKNNMNTMVGILALHERTLTDPSAVAALADAGSRMQSMRLLYDKLYRSAGFRELSLKDYLSALIDEILANFPEIVPVTVEKRIDDFMLDARRLQPLGIIINELLTNIMKYAFTGRTAGRILVSALQDTDNGNGGDIVVIVEDNGRGLPESVSLDQPSGFGLTMVQALSTQLGGTVRIERENGTRIVLRF